MNCATPFTSVDIGVMIMFLNKSLLGAMLVTKRSVTQAFVYCDEGLEIWTENEGQRTENCWCQCVDLDIVLLCYRCGRTHESYNPRLGRRIER